ncbi:unnamed protein product [Eruca vesicaria subsp. sativa]|uniref:Uncharacterized protein n=1 Tax=Eruca vesicaria subsp. sativa TaxID=29727 RepID=A0ABC8K9R7_ERUVS|nr:unnamed protein product [Eruca vesicaria subsp. sativa]
MDSLKILEADIEHANGLAAEIPMGKSSVRLQMKLVRADGRWNRSRYGRKATIREFYGVILPSLERLHINFSDLPSDNL